MLRGSGAARVFGNRGHQAGGYAAGVASSETKGSLSLRQANCQLIGEAEGRELGQAMMAGYETSTAARLIGRAHEVLEAGDLRYAAAEAVTALEVALGEVIRSRVTKDIADRVGSFWNLPIATRLAIAAALIGGIDEDQLRLAFRAIEVRRKVVHEGETPSRSAITEIRTLLQVAAHFVSGPRFRFPALPSGRIVYSEVTGTARA